MPAAAVIPALIAYIEIVAVKKLVVGSEMQNDSLPLRRLLFIFILPSMESLYCSLLSGTLCMSRLP